MDEELFMSKGEKGVYNQCLNTDLEKTFIPNKKANCVLCKI